MMIRWQQGEDATPFMGEAEGMAAALEARHGLHAADIADFFSSLHDARGNARRAYAWADVADAIRNRTQERTGS